MRMPHVGLCCVLLEWKKEMLNLSQLLTLARLDDSESSYRAAVLGLLLPMLAAHPDLGSRSVCWHVSRLKRALDLDQVRIYFDRFGRFCGYAWWTLVSLELGAKLLLESSCREIVVADFCTEGEALILDFRADLGELSNILLELHGTLGKACKSLIYFRHKNGQCLSRRIRLRDKSLLLSRRSLSARANEIAWLCSSTGKAALDSLVANLQRATDSGKAIELLNRLPRYAELPLPVMLMRLSPALDCGQYRVLCSRSGEPQGFCSWAWREEAEPSMDKPLHTWEIHEWRDGRDAVLCDAVATCEGIDDLTRELLSTSDDWLINPDDSLSSERAVAPRHISKYALLTKPEPEQKLCDLATWWQTCGKAQTCEL